MSLYMTPHGLMNMTHEQVKYLTDHGWQITGQWQAPPPQKKFIKTVKPKPLQDAILYAKANTMTYKQYLEKHQYMIDHGIIDPHKYAAPPGARPPEKGAWNGHNEIGEVPFISNNEESSFDNWPWKDWL